MTDQLTPEGAVSPLYLARSFADVSQSLSRLDEEKAVFQAIVGHARALVPGVEAAGITVKRDERFQTVAPSADYVAEVDRIQYELRSGPCVDAIEDGEIYRSGDVAGDDRWPEFGRRAAEKAGVHSMLGLRLFFEDGDDTVASLNLYSTQRHAFGEDSAMIGSIFATHAAIALSRARSQEQSDNLRRAQESNREIGMAMGVLMSRHALTQSQAFDLLRIASQHSHRKLRDIAAEVVETGMLELPPGGRASASSRN